MDSWTRRLMEARRESLVKNGTRDDSRRGDFFGLGGSAGKNIYVLGKIKTMRENPGFRKGKF